MPALDDLITIGAPPLRDWVIREGDNPRLQFVIKRNGLPVNLTSVTGTWEVRADYDDASPVIVNGSCTFPTPTSGTVRCDVTPAQTVTLNGAVPASADDNQLEARVGVFSIRLDDGTNKVTILGGSVIVARQVKQ